MDSLGDFLCALIDVGGVSDIFESSLAMSFEDVRLCAIGWKWLALGGKMVVVNGELTTLVRLNDSFIKLFVIDCPDVAVVVVVVVVIDGFASLRLLLVMSKLLAI